MSDMASRSGWRTRTVPPARVLVIDDEPANTTILARLLRGAGYDDVEVVNASRDALHRYEAIKPDIVLLDLHMPEPDGYELLGRMADPARSGVRPPVIVLTADATRTARERALDLGAADFLTKPLDHMEVLLRIRNHLASWFLEQRLAAANAELERAVAERTRSLQESLVRVRELAEVRRKLGEALVTAQEDERRRMADDLHDFTVQAIVAAAMRLDLLAQQLDGSPRLREEVEVLRADLGAAIDGARRLSFRLGSHTLARDGLEAALHELAAHTGRIPGPPVKVDVDVARDVDHEVAVALYRIAQEAVSNAHRHASASAIHVRLEPVEDGLRLEVADDGTGFSPPPAHLIDGHGGLGSMWRRAQLAGGSLHIQSEAGTGTAVTAWIPVA